MEGGPNIQEADTSVSENHEEEVNGSGCFFLFCDPRGRFHRLIALFFMCFLGFGKVILMNLIITFIKMR